MRRRKFESIPLKAEMLSDLKRMIRRRNWIIILQGGVIITLAALLAAK